MPPTPPSPQSRATLLVVALLCAIAAAASAASLAITRASWSGEKLYVSGTAPGGQSGAGSSRVPTSNGRLTADPLQ